jgi:hypothetical protein
MVNNSRAFIIHHSYFIISSRGVASMEMTTRNLTASVESHIPGRLRIRLHRRHRCAEVLAEVHEVLKDIEGIVEIVCNSKTGSVLVNYDPDAVEMDELMEVGRLANLVLNTKPLTAGHDETESWHRSTAAQRMVLAFRAWDRELHVATGGLIDLKLLIPLTLAGISVAKLILREDKTPVPWHVLLWYAYSVFIHMNRPMETMSPPASATA